MTDELTWPPPGLRGGHTGNQDGGATFRKELERIVDQSTSLEEFYAGKIKLQEEWSIEPTQLPPLPSKLVMIKVQRW